MNLPIKQSTRRFFRSREFRITPRWKRIAFLKWAYWHDWRKYVSMCVKTTQPENYEYSEQLFNAFINEVLSYFRQYGFDLNKPNTDNKCALFNHRHLIYLPDGSIHERQDDGSIKQVNPSVTQEIRETCRDYGYQVATCPWANYIHDDRYYRLRISPYQIDHLLQKGLVLGFPQHVFLQEGGIYFEV